MLSISKSVGETKGKLLYFTLKDNYKKKKKFTQGEDWLYALHEGGTLSCVYRQQLEVLEARFHCEQAQ